MRYYLIAAELSLMAGHIDDAIDALRAALGEANRDKNYGAASRIFRALNHARRIGIAS